MAQKKAPPLTGTLIARKGEATPPADALGRSAPPPAPVPAPASTPLAPPAASSKAAALTESLNFKVTSEFRIAVKSYAAAKNLKLNELLVLMFEEYRKNHT